MLDNGALDRLLLTDQFLQVIPIHRTFRGFQEVRISSTHSLISGSDHFPAYV